MTKTKTCKQCKESFLIDEADQSFYEKMQVPAPSICSTCRFKRRALWRNEVTLYNRKCDGSGESIISMYNPKSPYKVYSQSFYGSGEWNPQDFGMEYDTDRPFFEQFGDLLKKVPKRNLFISYSTGPTINSAYINYAGGAKDCYLIFNSGPENENILYSRGVQYSQDCLDLYYVKGGERCYECVNAQKCNSVLFGKNVTSCVSCILVENCSGCTNCFGCVNVRNGSYQFFNETLSKEDYEKRVEEIMGSYANLEEAKKKFAEHRLKFPVRATNNLKVMNSTGDYLVETNNVKDSFEITSAENCRYLYSSRQIKDSYGTIGYGFQSELLLECVGTGYTTRGIACALCDKNQNIEYCFSVENSHDCFGCDGLKNAEYCILNKQYSKEEYEKLRAHIIKELTEKELYGLMMPPEIAPFKYNETVGQDNFPMAKEEAVAQGFGWEDEIQETHGKETTKTGDIPEHIKDVSDSIMNEILACEETGRNYKITAQELQFYRKMNIPIPRKSFFARHKARIERRGPYKFWERNCAHCEKKVVTNYAPERPEILYCEECYQKEVI